MSAKNITTEKMPNMGMSGSRPTRTMKLPVLIDNVKKGPSMPKKTATAKETKNNNFYKG